MSVRISPDTQNQYEFVTQLNLDSRKTFISIITHKNVFKNIFVETLTEFSSILKVSFSLIQFCKTYSKVSILTKNRDVNSKCFTAKLETAAIFYG